MRPMGKTSLKTKNDHRRVEAASGLENGNGCGAISNLTQKKEIVK